MTDGVFSMDGDIAPLPGIVEAAEAFGAAVFVDDAHASGVLGRDGRGTVDHFGLHGRVAIQVGTLSKAVGALGGYVAGSQALREILTQRARPFLFSTSHPPAVVAACREAIRVMQDEPGAARAAVGQHPPVQGRAGPARLRHRPLRDADHAGHDGRPGDRDAVQRPADGGGRVRPAGRLPDRRPRPGADPDDRHRRPHRRAARPGARGVLDRRSRAGASSGGERAGGPARGPSSIDAAARDLPLDAHLHTDLSPDSDVPIDASPPQAVERGIAEIAITDHVDFEPGAPAYAYATFEDRERIVREAAERWADRGVAIRFGVEITCTSRVRGRDPRPPRRATPTTSSSARSTSTATRRTPAEHVAGWVAGRSLAEIVAPYFDEVAAGARTGCSTRSATSTSSSATSRRT